jgi:hypothetical protein
MRILNQALNDGGLRRSCHEAGDAITPQRPLAHGRRAVVP